MEQSGPPAPPYAALATAGYGAVLGSIFPVMTVMTIADVSGGLSVPIDSAALVNTMQNVGSIAGILAAPAFAAGIGRGRTMALAGSGFLLASVACACAPSLPWMLVARLAHGACGGVLPLMFMLLVMTSLKPGAGRFEGMTLFATSTALFFGFAAILGGFLVDHLGWRSLFWVQALAVIPYVLASLAVLRQERGNPAILRKADWGNHALLSIGLGMIVFALSEGERHFWSDAWWVPGLLLGGAICTIVALIDMGRSDRPLLTLAVFRRPTFSVAILLSLVFRFGSLFAIFIVPQYLGRLQGLRPAEFGRLLTVMMPATLLALVVSYFVARRFDTRLLLSAGLGSFALASWLCTGLSSDWALDQLWTAASVAGLGMGLFSVGVLRFAVFGATMQDGPTVGVVFNLARVFGIVTGLAMLSHLLVEREKFHSASIVESLAATDPTTAQRLAGTLGTFGRMTADATAAASASTAALGRAASGQAFALAFADAFTVTAAVLALGAVLVWALPAIPPEIAPQSSRRRSIA